MGTIEQNLEFWSTDYSWDAQDDEWSESWGGTPYLWHGVIFPRVISMVPVACGLEIAPGHGRFTQYLRNLCQYIYIVDLASECIESCRLLSRACRAGRDALLSGATLRQDEAECTGLHSSLEHGCVS